MPPLRIRLVVGSSYEAEMEISEPGPLYGRRFRVHHGVEPRCPAAWRAQAARVVGYITGYGEPLPLAVAQAYNDHCRRLWQIAIDKYGPEFCAPQPDAVKGIAEYVADGTPTGHYIYHDLADQPQEMPCSL